MDFLSSQLPDTDFGLGCSGYEPKPGQLSAFGISLPTSSHIVCRVLPFPTSIEKLASPSSENRSMPTMVIFARAMFQKGLYPRLPSPVTERTASEFVR